APWFLTLASTLRAFPLPPRCHGLVPWFLTLVSARHQPKVPRGKPVGFVRGPKKKGDRTCVFRGPAPFRLSHLSLATGSYYLGGVGGGVAAAGAGGAGGTGFVAGAGVPGAAGVAGAGVPSAGLASGSLS